MSADLEVDGGGQSGDVRHPPVPCHREPPPSSPGPDALDALFTRYPKQEKKENAVQEAIKVGDVVQLRSGGMHWTVRALAPVTAGGEMFVHVVSAGAVGAAHVQRDQMPLACFVKVTP